MAVVLFLLFILVACSDPAEPDPAEVDLALESVVSGLEQPTHLTAPAGDSRLFVVERPGRIRIIEDGVLLPEPFLDLTGQVTTQVEQGMLSLAFHPEFAEKGYFYVDYTDANGDTRVERYSVGSDPNVADPSSAKLILAVDQPGPDHNGGYIAFGPDGMLYVSLGDGGGEGDPLGNAQDRGTLLGSVLRIDVDAGDPYAIPPANPFAGEPGARGEIWAYGLRNPWRFAFDWERELLFIGDVGQFAWEEVDVAALDAGGLNFGWNVMEGPDCYGAESCDSEGLEPPVVAFPHREGDREEANCSITGGYVYRGSTIESLRGHYFYSDYCAGWLRTFRYQDGAATQEREWPAIDLSLVTSFGEDAAGELYMLTQEGNVFRIVAGS